MSDQPLSVTFWTLFRSLLRGEKQGDNDAIRARQACTWLTAEMQVLRRYCNADEAELIGLVYTHWSKHHEAPSYTILKHNLQQDSNPVIEEHLKDYEEARKDLPRLSVADLPAHLATKIEEFSRDRLETTLKNAIVINSVGADIAVPGKKGEKRKVKGPEDALTYIVERMESGAFGNVGTAPTHGSLQENAGYVLERYEQLADPSNTANRRILTGLAGIDSHVKLRKGQFLGLLGYAGHGKTRFGRSVMYNAALAGNNILHFTLEQTYEEELNRYACIHSYHTNWGKDAKGESRGVSIAALEDNALTAAAWNFLKKEVIPDLLSGKTVPGNISIRQPTEGTTWDAVKTLIRIQDRQVPMDAVLVDYLTMCSTSGRKNSKEEMEEVIQDAKNFAMTFRGNEGLLLCTPVQANRDGWEDAKKHGGRYELNSIYMYSQFERALDVLLSVYSDDDLDHEKKVILGICKHRRGKLFPPYKAGVIHGCGAFRDMEAQGVSEKTLDDCMDIM